MLQWGIFLVGLMTVAQFSFWVTACRAFSPLYLRGTGESFAANVGGRMFGTSAAYFTIQLANFTPGGTPPMKLAHAAAIVGTMTYMVGFIASLAARTEAERTA